MPVAEEVFGDTFEAIEGGAFIESEETFLANNPKVLQQVHAFVNVSAVLAVISLVAIHRNKAFDLTGYFI